MIRIRPALLLALLAGLFLSACAARTQPGVPPGIEGWVFPQELAPQYDKLMREGERNWVLNLNELAVQALRRGDREFAKRALDESMLLIEAVFGESPEAARARSLFFDEDVKLFKGDPHERCLTYFLRGILYMQDGDWENARACMRMANFQDGFAEEEQNRSDWTIFDYLIGVCEVQLNRPFFADEAFSRAEATFADFPQRYKELLGNALRPTTPTLHRVGPEDNFLLISQTGEAPRKIRTGEFGQYLSYRRDTTGDPVSVVWLGETKLGNAGTLDSVFYQAVTRGGRPFDRIVGRKVVFKKGTETAGAVSAGLGYVVFADADSPEQAIVGLALIATGAALTMFADFVRTGADTRQWTSIPDSIGTIKTSAGAGEHPLRAVNADGTEMKGSILLPEPGSGIAVALTFPGRDPFLLLPPQNISPEKDTNP